ncbi:tripartite tricarboxylate transporter permease [Alkalihalobacterium bogoriense]|uniref:tripartite tricarboxylate transporter permease n=1 Tax=Alkalihalobacterium bogoriense TaxID=246272 RepID=UPI00068874A0|nr:tripartite tricarboxylate transporter permease [Alkalihalobacterium bogoriense]
MEFIIQSFEFHHIIVLVIGLLLGILVGALPGLTPTMGVALMIPFTFSLGPTEGLILLGGIYCGSVFGGSIPAILFNVPGAPANVATTFDGYEMTKQGHSRKALELATISSVIGGLFGMFLLLFFAPVFADFSLRFGPTESFWIAIFGITVIAAISDGSVLKNLIGGGIGIALSFIGINTVTGTARFTFGMDSLVGGLHLVAVLIGLFAFPQALRLLENLHQKNSRQPTKETKQSSSVKESFLDIVKKPKALFLGSGLGAFIGMIPGAGGNIASLLAYNETKRFSKEKEKFGKGHKDGVIASESANNAMVGGSLVPLLTLGIPGSPTAAIFLGGLLIHGIWPGNNLFVDHANVAYTFLYSMVAAQILLLLLALPLIKYMTKLTNIPAYFMAPIILSFSIIGAYTTQNNVFDIYTMIVIGFIMFFMHKIGFSAAPIALGFILGSIAEEGLLQGLQIGGAHGSAFAFFFTGTWNVILYSLIIATILVSFVQSMKSTKNKKLGIVTKMEWFMANAKSANFGWTYIFLANLLLLCIFAMNDMVFGQRIFPQLTFSFMLFFVLLAWLKQMMTEGKQTTLKNNIKKSVLTFIIAVTIICSLITILSFYVQVFLLMVLVPLYMYCYNRQAVSVKKVMITAVVFPTMLYFVFSYLLNVPLP